VPAVDVSDRDYYEHLHQHDVLGVYISAPAISRLSGTWSFFLA